MKVFPSMAAGITLALSLSSAAFAQHYEQINLDANVAGAAESTDPQLINGWGLARYLWQHLVGLRRSHRRKYSLQRSRRQAGSCRNHSQIQSQRSNLPHRHTNRPDPQQQPNRLPHRSRQGCGVHLLHARWKHSRMEPRSRSGSRSESTLYQRRHRSKRRSRIRLYRPYLSFHRRQPLPLRAPTSSRSASTSTTMPSRP